MKIICLTVFLVIATLSRRLLGEGPCPDQDILNPNDAQCYDFVEDSSASTYDDALIACQSKNKVLADISSADQLTFIAQSMQKIGWSQVFVGLKYVKTGWKWVDTNMPLRGQGCQVSAFSEDAGYLSTLSSAMTVEKCINYCSGEGNLYAAVQQSQFCYCANDFIWPTAASNCSLPCSGSSDEYCGSLLNSVAYFVADGAYDNWKNGRPTVFGSCAAIQVDRSSDQWVDKSCTVNLPFICRFNSETATVPTDDAAGYQCGDDVCYYLYTSSTMSWINAERFCKAKGGLLASVDRETRQDMISRLLFSSDLQTDDLVWIGAVNYQWFLSSGSQLAFDGWISANEPVAPETYPCAATAVTYDGKFGLKSTKCNDLAEGQNRFVCSSAAVGVEAPSTTTSTTTLRPTTRSTTKTTTTTTTTKKTTTTKTTPAPELPIEETTETPIVVAPTEEPIEGETTVHLEEVTTPREVPTEPQTSEKPTTTTESTTKSTTEKKTTSTTEATTKTTKTPTTTTKSTTTKKTTPTTTAIAYCNATCRNVTTGNSTIMECWSRRTTTTAAPTTTARTTTSSSTTSQTSTTSQSSTSTKASTASTTSTRPTSTTKPAVIYSAWYDDVVPCGVLLMSTTTTEAPIFITPPEAQIETKSSTKTSSSSFPWWAILIIVVGGVILLGVLAGVLIYALKKRAGLPNQVNDGSETARGSGK